MSQLEIQRERPAPEHVRPPKASRPKKEQRQVENLHLQQEIETIPSLINVQALQFQSPWMVQNLESRITGMREAGAEIDEFLQVLMMRFQKLHERIQALREGAGRVLILEILEMDELKRGLKMLLSELRNLVRQTESREVEYTYRLLRKEYISSITKTFQILCLPLDDLQSPRIASRRKVTRPPQAQSPGHLKRQAEASQSSVFGSHSTRYEKSLAKKERHLPQIDTALKPDRDLGKCGSRRKSKRGVDTPRPRKQVKDVVDSPVDSPNSTTAERLLRRFRQTALEDERVEAGTSEDKARGNGQRRKAQRSSGTSRLRKEKRLLDSPLSTTTENIVRQFRQTAVDDDVEAFEAKSVEEKSPRASGRDSVAEESVIGSRASAATGSQASQASDASGATGTTASQSDQSGASSSAISSLQSTFASSFQTSAFTESSAGNSTMLTVSMDQSTAMSGDPSSIIESTK
ncbi:hypothetical protein QFC20_007143 [Naganishia adeliensis]|uniref:Uncharacterized protein n=1 Tax=Naganishia adeliensis TaxID=92952 RepID=A0ACC2V2I1_9TREE|nr:hypothetical protein QFC20_007143 [Naganishia adeliensis]